MAASDRLTTLIEAARFIEVGETNSSVQDDRGQDQTKMPVKGKKGLKGCLRRELQNSSDGHVRARAFYNNDELRQDHNRMEKMRRRDMRKEFDDLKNRIPTLQKGKHSSVAVLQSAAEYIGELRDLEKSLKSKQQLLHDEHRSLQHQLASLQQTQTPCNCIKKKEGNQDASPDNDESRGDVSTRKRKRTTSDSSTISADSPKMFIGDRDEDFEMAKEEKYVSLCKKQCRLNNSCSSTSSGSSSACLTITTPGQSTDCSTNVSPVSEATSSLDSGVATASERNSSSKNATPSPPLVGEILKPSQTSKVPNHSHRNLSKNATKCVEVRETLCPSNSAPKESNTPSQQMNDSGNKPENARQSSSTGTKKETSTSMLLRQHILASPRKSLPLILSTPGSSNKRKIPLADDKRHSPEKTVTSLKPKPDYSSPGGARQPAVVLKCTKSVRQPVRAVSGAATTATVTPVTIVAANPVKATQVMLVQPVNSANFCQPVVLALPSSNSQGDVAKVPNSYNNGGNTNNVTQPKNVIRLQKVSSTKPLVSESKKVSSYESQRYITSDVHHRSRIVVLRPTCPISVAQPVKQTVPTNPAVISILSPPATPSNVVIATSQPPRQKP